MSGYLDWQTLHNQLSAFTAWKVRVKWASKGWSCPFIRASMQSNGKGLYYRRFNDRGSSWQEFTEVDVINIIFPFREDVFRDHYPSGY